MDIFETFFNGTPLGDVTDLDIKLVEIARQECEDIGREWIKILHDIYLMHVELDYMTMHEILESAKRDRNTLFRNIKICGWLPIHSMLIPELTKLIKDIR